MTLDDAIKHARDKAEENRKGATYNFPTLSDYYDMCLKCAEEHEQLVEWLEELKDRRETNFNYVQLMDYRYRDGYSKAIDDFAEKIAIYGTYDDWGNVVDVLEIAEKLKKECAE